ncbi:uncharacterized protein AruCF_2280 [Achromobacter ruhlandii]|nr:uncharacterized protein AruCF_2280 [Achromobacter ruhlandii]
MTVGVTVMDLLDGKGDLGKRATRQQAVAFESGMGKERLGHGVQGFYLPG